MSGPLPAPADDEVQALVARILARNEYASWHWTRRVQELLERLRDLRLDDPVLYWTIVGGLALLASLLLGHLIWSLRVALRTPAPPPPRPVRDDAEPAFLDQADALAERGRFLEAARCVHLAVLRLLLGRHVIELGRADPNRTLRERVRAARLPAAEREDLLTLLDRFERSWFRDRHAERELYESWRLLHARLGVALGSA